MSNVKGRRGPERKYDWDDWIKDSVTLNGLCFMVVKRGLHFEGPVDSMKTLIRQRFKQSLEDDYGVELLKIIHVRETKSVLAVFKKVD